MTQKQSRKKRPPFTGRHVERVHVSVAGMGFRQKLSPAVVQHILATPTTRNFKPNYVKWTVGSTTIFARKTLETVLSKKPIISLSMASPKGYVDGFYSTKGKLIAIGIRGKILKVQ